MFHSWSHSSALKPQAFLIPPTPSAGEGGRAGLSGCPLGIFAAVTGGHFKLQVQNNKHSC